VTDFTHPTGRDARSVRSAREVWLPEDREQWEARWIDDDPQEKLVFYCGKCAEREFGAPYRNA
jgi:hypothetical protein